MSKDKKPFTWADLKKAVNKIPANRLNDRVIWWGEERGGKIDYVQILEEDYHEDGDTGSMPKSVMLENLESDQTAEDFPLAFKKGTRILCTDMY